MKEIKVSELDKEDIVGLRALNQEEEELALLAAQFRSKQHAFWKNLREKYSMGSDMIHYIKSNTIYKQEI